MQNGAKMGLGALSGEDASSEAKKMPRARNIKAFGRSCFILLGTLLEVVF